jgi:outer membrane protein OmpA-like peptidoglycan-associated protein
MKQKLIFATLIASISCCALGAQSGLLGEYYNGTNFERKVTSRTDAKIDFAWDGVRPAPGMNETDYSIRWTGSLQAPQTGKYVFSARVDDGIRLWVNGARIIDAWGPHDMGAYSGSIQLEAGKYYDLKVEYYNGIFEGEIQLRWQLPDGSTRPVEAKYLFVPGAQKPAAPPAKPAAQAQKKPVKKPGPPKKTTPAKPKPQPVETPATKPAAPEVSAVEQQAKQRELELKYIYFVKSKDAILPESQATLDDWVVFLKQKPGAGIDILGHTDDLGNIEKNQALSEQRARIVADYLMSKGLEKERIHTRGFGGTKPIYVNAATEKERALNRRVEIRVR